MMSTSILPLAYCCVLVVDDDYFLAEATQEALIEEGATILGPYGKAADALRSLDKQSPTLAVVDLNLGTGPDFTVARALALRNIPTIIATGYDKGIIPSDLVNMPCLQKPITRSKLLTALIDLNKSIYK